MIWNLLIACGIGLGISIIILLLELLYEVHCINGVFFCVTSALFGRAWEEQALYSVSLDCCMEDIGGSG